MTNMVRCYNCGGQKSVKGIGWMEVECSSCSGTGKIAAKPDTLVLSVPCETSDSSDDVVAESVQQVIASKSSAKASVVSKGKRV